MKSFILKESSSLPVFESFRQRDIEYSLLETKTSKLTGWIALKLSLSKEYLSEIQNNVGSNKINIKLTHKQYVTDITLNAQILI